MSRYEIDLTEATCHRRGIFRISTLFLPDRFERA